MLKKEFRLSPKKDFWKQRKVHTPFFTLYKAENGLEKSRFGFQISKKIDKRAVVRNRIKRILSSCVEQEFTKIKSGYDMMFVAKREILEANKQTLCESLVKTFEREQLLV